MKRLFDVSISLVALVFAAPLMVLMAIAIYLDLGWPVIFRQIRPGLHGRPFEMIKFRTMRGAPDSESGLLPDAQRLTRMGTFLRKASIDELPELWNVLKGDMSLVGPRPLLMEYLPLYSKEQMRRHEVRPGITGWAQVNGRNALDWEDRFRLDVWYVDNRTFWLDLRILWLTLWSVLGARGVNQEGHVTCEKFRGTIK